ncbi:hypothetical protein L2E82_45997 [Cichorium intybus]|uniref:Uncharacterized protein n=1 Tax=Cichorium intybus TaxID=13427 RepID=A0ACB8ZVW9_CICIN|nr:hypothetical protein L2E82_45997 [Cichorium intybus]
MLKQQIQDFENLIEVEDRCLANRNVELDDLESFRVKEKAIQLMDHVKTSLIEEYDQNVDDLLLDFFRDELITSKGVKSEYEFESRLLRMAKSWVRGEDDGSLEWEMEGRREVCIQEMDKRGKWKDFEEEQKEIGIEMTTILFEHLLHELSIDLLNVRTHFCSCFSLTYRFRRSRRPSRTLELRKKQFALLLHVVDELQNTIEVEQKTEKIRIRVLIVEKLQELHSIRIQKLTKQGHFLPEEDNKFLERIRAAVEEEERQAMAAADTSTANDAITNALNLEYQIIVKNGDNKIQEKLNVIEEKE